MKSRIATLLFLAAVGDWACHDAPHHGAAVGEKQSSPPPAPQHSFADLLIAIDVGHGTGDPGATSARGVPEYIFNHRLAEEVVQGLQQAGFRTLLVNGDGSLVGNKGLVERTRRANEAMADLMLSIHHDSVQGRYLEWWSVDGKRQRFCDRFSGYSIFFSAANRESERSRLFAAALGDELRERGLRPSLHHAEDIDGERRDLIDPDRGIYRVDYWVVRDSNMPAVLFEAGVIVNRDEETRMDQLDQRRLLVDSIVAAIGSWNRLLSPDQVES